jgi:glucosamine--fructose-6-phosphate aminotransferase (isomerizing)
MLNEIHQQPEALVRTLEVLVEQKAQIKDLISKDIKSILFVARGTSDHVADYGQYLFPIRCGLVATRFDFGGFN